MRRECLIWVSRVRMLPMMDGFRKVGMGLAVGVALATATAASAQSEQHGRKYKPPPPTAHVVITVEKGFNEKPLMNAAVIFHAVREGKEDANLEVKTDPDGKATIDLLEIGSHVTMQVIARGFATYATEFDLSGDSKEMTVKLERPRSQISGYGDAADKPSTVQPGVQEHVVPKPAPATPPASTTPPVSTPPATNTPPPPGQSR